MSGNPYFQQDPSGYGPRVPPGGPRHPDPEDLTLYAMQLLGGEEANHIAQHLEHCSECRRELASIQGDLAMFSLTAEMQVPTAETRQRLLKQVAREKKVIPISQAAPPPVVLTSFGRSTFSDADEAPKRRTGLIVLGWTGWAVAAGLAGLSAALYRDHGHLQGTLNSQAGQVARLSADAAAAHQTVEAITDPAAVRVTLSLTAKPIPPAPLGRAIYNSQKGTLVFLATKMDPIALDKVYELWLIPADGKDPIPAGTFRPDDSGNAMVVLPELPKGVPAKGFGVTLEAEGGSPTPTKPVLMAGS